MYILYDAISTAKNGNSINGTMVLDSHCIIDGQLSYQIVNCQFSCNSQVCVSRSSSGVIKIPRGATEGAVAPGSALWSMEGTCCSTGKECDFRWVTDTGCWFKHIDETIFQEEMNEYQHLPPIIELCCDNVDINSKGLFLPYGRLKLKWRSSQWAML
jgi:hypothetical protein